jgi:hypothetical protein
MLPFVGLLLGTVLLVGLTLAWHRIGSGAVRKRASSPAGLLVASVLFLAVAGWGRAWLYGPNYAA